jgi:hypothetical protein
MSGPGEGFGGSGSLLGSYLPELRLLVGLIIAAVVLNRLLFDPTVLIYWAGAAVVAYEAWRWTRVVALHFKLKTKGWQVTARESMRLYDVFEGVPRSIPGREDCALLPFFNPEKKDWDNLVEAFAQSDLWQQGLEQ